MSEKMKIERYILNDGTKSELIVSDGCTIADIFISGHDIFKIVDSVDSSYRVWNIGEYMGRADLIPLCQMENAYDLNIRRDTLKAIRLPECEVRILSDAACYGVSSLQEAQEILKSEQCGWLQGKKRDLAEKSLPIFEKIYREGRS